MAEQTNATAPEALSDAANLEMLKRERRANNVWHKLTRNKMAVVGLIIVAFMVFLAVFAPVISPYDPNATDMSNMFATPGQAGHLFGTDSYGRDLLSRIIYGARVSIFIAIGGNREATRLCGINVKRYKVVVHIICSVLAGLSGIMLASRLGSAQPTAGTSQDLNVVAACILGGNSLAGGVATMVGTLVGVAIMATITVALTMMRVSAYWQNVCVGVILIIAVCMDDIKNMAKLKA